MAGGGGTLGAAVDGVLDHSVNGGVVWAPPNRLAVLALHRQIQVMLEEPEQSLSCAAELQDFVEDQADGLLHAAVRVLLVAIARQARRRRVRRGGPSRNGCPCLRAGRRALKLCYGLTDCSGGEFDLGAERRALPQFVHGFGNLWSAPTVGPHHAPPNSPGFPGSLRPPVEMVYIAFTCESKCRVAGVKLKPQALSPGPARCGGSVRTHSDNASQRAEMRLRRACLSRDRFALLAYTWLWAVRFGRNRRCWQESGPMLHGGPRSRLRAASV